MSTSEAVYPHIPFLRRYARVLVGEQGQGDAYVLAALEALAEVREEIGTDDPRVALYRVFSKIWNSVAVNRVPEQPSQGHERRLDHLTPIARQAFLLGSLEGFTDEEGARILDVTMTRFREFVDTAGRELAAEIATDVLIIEDEPLIAMDLESLVEGLGHNVLGIARTHAEAVQLAHRKTPGLILADIQLADGSSGIQAVNELVREFEVPVVFITAYPERFLTGERPEPAFLIAKPFRPAHVSAVVSQALFFDRRARPRQLRTGT
jgi:CheY-like chemotaxis protein